MRQMLRNAPIHDRDPGYVWFNLKIAYDKWQTAKSVGLPEKTIGHFKARAKMFVRMIEDELRIEPEESFREEYETMKARLAEDSAPGQIQLNNNPIFMKFKGQPVHTVPDHIIWRLTLGMGYSEKVAREAIKLAGLTMKTGTNGMEMKVILAGIIAKAAINVGEFHGKEPDSPKDIPPYTPNPRKGRRVVNPWAVCRAMQKKHKWSEAKYERCVLQLKAKMGYRKNPLENDPFFEIGEEVEVAATGLRGVVVQRTYNPAKKEWEYYVREDIEGEESHCQYPESHLLRRQRGPRNGKQGYRYANNPPPFKFTPGERVNTGIASGLRQGQQGIVTRRWWDGALGNNMYEVNMMTDQKYLTFWETDLSSASPSIPMKFKIGDRVKVINPQATTFGRVGKVVNFFIDNTMKAPEYDVVLDGENFDITYREESLAPEGPKAAILPPKKPKVDVEGYQQKFVVGDLVKVRTELADSPSGYLETHVVKTGYDPMGGYFTVVLRHKGHLITYPEKHVQMVRKTTFFNNPGRAMHNPPEKRLYLRDLQQYDMDKGESEVRALEMMIDSGSGDPRLSIQFWRDVRTYGLAEAFVYLKGYADQGLWNGDLNEVKQQVNKMLAQHGRVRRFNNNPWLVAGPQVNLYDQPGMAMASATGQQVPAQVTPVDVSTHPLKALPAPGNGGEPQRVRAERSPVGERERARRHRFAMRQRRDSRTGKFYDNPSQTHEIYRPNPYAYRVWDWAEGGYTGEMSPRQRKAQNYTGYAGDWFKTEQSAEDEMRKRYLDDVKMKMDEARASGDTDEVQYYKDLYAHPEDWRQYWESEIKPVWVDSKDWNKIPFTSPYKKNPYAKNPPDSSGFEKIAESKKGENATAIYVKYDQAWQVLTVRYVEQVGKQKKGLEVEVAAYPGEAQRMWRFVKKHGFSAFLKAIKKAGRTVRAKRAYEEATTESTYKQPELFGSQHEEDDVVRFAIATADQVAHEVQERDFNQAVQNLMRLREIMIRAQERKYTGAWQQLQAQWEKARNLIEGAWPGKIKGIK